MLPSPVTEARLGAVCPWTSSDGPPGHSSGWEGGWVAGANKGILLNELLKHPSGPLQNEVASSKPECTRDSQVGFSLTLGILSISGKPAVHHPEYHSTNRRPPGKHRRMPSPERGVQGQTRSPRSGQPAKKEQVKEWPLRSSRDRERRAVTWSRATWWPPAGAGCCSHTGTDRSGEQRDPCLYPQSCQSLRAQKCVPSAPLLV